MLNIRGVVTVNIGDRVIVRAGYTFDGDIGIVRDVYKEVGLIKVEVPTYFCSSDGNGRHWAVLCGEYEPIPGRPVWADRLEAEKDLDKLLAKYAG